MLRRFQLLPRFQPTFLALTMALLLVLGTLGIYSAEASSFRATVQGSEAHNLFTLTDAYDPGNDTLIITSPGLPY